MSVLRKRRYSDDPYWHFGAHQIDIDNHFARPEFRRSELRDVVVRNCRDDLPNSYPEHPGQLGCVDHVSCVVGVTACPITASREPILGRIWAATGAKSRKTLRDDEQL